MPAEPQDARDALWLLGILGDLLLMRVHPDEVGALSIYV